MHLLTRLRLAVLHDGVASAGQAHAFTLDGANLPGGMYVVRAVGETFAAMRRAVLVQ